MTRDIAAIQADLDAIVAPAREEARGLEPDEIARYQTLEGELATARQSLELFARHDAYGKPVLTGGPQEKPKRDPQVEAFEAYLRTGVPNADLEPGAHTEFAQTLTTTGGGYTIPNEAMRPLVDIRKAFGGIRSVAEVIQTSTGAPLPWPTIDDTANTGEVVALGSTIAGGADLVFGTVSLSAFEYMSGGASQLPLRVPKQLLQDSEVDIAALVTRKLGERIARAQAADFAIGDGSGNPKGLFYRTAAVQTASGGALTYDALLDLVFSVDPAYWASAGFVCGATTLRQIAGLLDAADRPLWLPASTGTLGDNPVRGQLMGYPLTVDAASPAFSTTATDDPAGSPAAGEGYLAFGDIAEGYIIRDVAGVEVIADPYGRAGYAEMQYFAIARADATIKSLVPYKLLQGYHS